MEEFIHFLLFETRQDGEDFGSVVESVLNVVAKHVPEAKLEQARKPPEFSIVLPLKDKRKFGDLFAELEGRKAELGINSFGLSSNTLEQVFLK